MEEQEGQDVNLYIYDLTKGLAKQLSQVLLGKQLDGIWHTGIVVYGREYFFGGGGIESCRPCGTILGQPTQVHRLGTTQVTYSLFLEYLGELGMSAYCGEKYNLFNHNCNNFSNDVSQFLTGNSIPSYITELPQEVLNTPIGQAMKPLIDSLAYNPTGSRASSDVPQASVFDAQVSGSDQPGSSAPTTTDSKVSTEKKEEPKPAAPSNDSDEEDDLFIQRLRERRKSNVPSRLCLFKETDPAECADSIKQNVPESLLSEEELSILDQMKSAFVAPSDSLLDDDWDKTLPPVKPNYFLVIGKLLGRTDLPPMILTPLLKLLQMAFLREDVVGLLCTSDDKTIIDFVSRCECQTQNVQIETLRLLSNMCSCRQGYSWLTSEKEWTAHGTSTSNAKIIKGIVITMLLSGTEGLCEAASCAVYNFARYQVSDDNAVEFGGALLQMLSTVEFSEPTVFYAVSALYGLMRNGEVLCLANVMGFNTYKYVGMSDRVNQLIMDMGILLEEKY
ncbi:uncharacterized protein [Diadema antillarum]|uniref:uncharacterized protein n=1 Tax=Diadema antillarum TaxID=105358 RepID=UPI003A86572A